MIVKQLKKDIEYTKNHLSSKEWDKLRGSTILITGCAGFIGYYLMHFLYQYKDELDLKAVIGLDNFILGQPKWLSDLLQDERFIVKKFNIINDRIEDIPEAESADYIIHMASIASPVYYRQHPIETLDANIWGLRNLLDFYKNKAIKGLLFFSSSETYGDPDPKAVPTDEEYYGNVCFTGPRSCYDESKRFGETMCMLFAQEYKMPIGVVRPFNNFGPGMRLDDKRVPADFASNILSGNDIVILSNGAPSRTFCYIADAVAGYIKILLYGEYGYFNIGIDEPEISISQLAEIYKKVGIKIAGYKGNVVYKQSEDTEYLTNNPQRRCPRIEKAKSMLGYNPEIKVEEGVSRFLTYLVESEKER